MVRTAVAAYIDIATLWIRAGWVYRRSFLMLVLGNLVITSLDLLALIIMFAHIDSLAGFSLGEVILLYGASSLALGFADTGIGSVERIGQYVRTGRLDQMMTKPVPLLVQVCADQFTLRRLGRISQSAVAFAWGATYVEWDPLKVLVACAMVISGTVIYFCVFVTGSCIQFWTVDASEFANAFTYGGNTVLQYPLTIAPKEVARALTLLLPLAFVNWYPCLYLLDRTDPFGFPAWLQFASPLAAVVMVIVATLVWRLGVRHYTSTGS